MLLLQYVIILGTPVRHDSQFMMQLYKDVSSQDNPDTLSDTVGLARI